MSLISVTSWKTKVVPRMTHHWISISATTKHPKGIMNTAYDNPERPSTPSYIGNYESHPENGLGASYLYREEPPVTKVPLPSSSSTVGFLPPEKKTKHRRNQCNKSFIVVALLILFMALAIVMMALYFSRESKDHQVTENGGTSEQTVTVKLLFCVVFIVFIVSLW